MSRAEKREQMDKKIQETAGDGRVARVTQSFSSLQKTQLSLNRLYFLQFTKPPRVTNRGRRQRQWCGQQP